ncbi:FAD-binding Berberine family protein [Abeliophyllum distichum]|uniref:FAD-binding Berberine family protein n=1 Tax=Abeliophyllum distichum TaxID=126358 RepID=A0ABD1Q2H9_9LAMI
MVIGAHLPEMKTPGISATFKGLYLGPRNHALSILDREFPELGIVQGDCKEMSLFSTSRGPRASYINYIDYDIGVMDVTNSSSPSVDAVEIARVWGEKYFLKNYDRLVKAKTLIDPLNVFRHEQGIFPMPTADGRANI